jgi:Fe-S-cluster containining protein
MIPSPESLPSLARKAKGSTKVFFDKLKKENPRLIDDAFHGAHEAVFEHVDCLTCANCCKTTSPIFYERDIERLAKALHLKPSQFIGQYLRVDEDRDYVLKSAPCPFLAADNTCDVYHHRPTACREYPHTDRKRMHQILDLTLRNTSVCPAVFTIVERMKQEAGVGQR